MTDQETCPLCGQPRRPLRIICTLCGEPWGEAHERGDCPLAAQGAGTDQRDQGGRITQQQIWESSKESP